MQYIWLIMFCLSVMSLRGQSIGHEPHSNNYYYKIQEDFKMQRVDAGRLPAFEKRAMQKVKDMFNYLEIISNKSYDTTLREEALKACQGLFIANAKAKTNLLTRKNQEQYEVSNFLKELLKAKTSQLGLKLSNIKTEKKFEFDEDLSLYKAVLAVHVETSWETSKAIVQQDYLIEVQLKKIVKKFGSKTEEIWEIALADWYTRP